MASSKSTFEVGHVNRGLFTALPSHLIPDGFCAYTKNVDFVRAVGAASKRKGIALESTGPVDANTKVTGLHQFKRSSTGVTYIFASAGSDIYDATTSGAWVSRYAGAMAGVDVNFATFGDMCIAVSSTEATQKSTGGAFGVLLGSPPANAKFVLVFKNRLIILNSSAGKSRVHWSAPGDPENWQAASGAGFQDLDVSDGDEITGAAIVGGVVVIFKTNSAWAMLGVGPPTDLFTFRKIQAPTGCASGRSVVAFGNFVIYLSASGVHSISEGLTWGNLSPNIRYDLEALTKTGAAGGRLGRRYLVAYDSDADGKNDSAYVLDTETGAWSNWSNIDVSVFCTYLDESLVSGASEIKNLRRHDSGEDDEGSAIEYIYRAKSLAGDDLSQIVNALEAWLESTPIAGKILTVRTRVDGVQMDSQDLSLTSNQAIVGAARDVRTVSAHLPGTCQGRLLQLEFRNNELAAAIRLYRFGLKYNVFSDQDIDT